ncbi:MAG: hypothetical protein HRT35_25825 [Algicola sp.]|nr:hypothetical protein [Algicola sp.]
MTPWAIKDKQWLKTRREEWVTIRNNLATTTLLVKEIKQLERYFLRGKDEEQILLIFRLWFHPDDSVENWNDMSANVTARDFIQSCLFYRRNAIAPTILNEGMAEYGFMGGKEQRILDFLYRGANEDGNYQFDCGNIVKAYQVKLNFAALMFNLNAWIRTDEPNRHSPIQYMVEDWYDLRSEAIGGDRRFVNFLKLILVRVKKDIALAEKFDLPAYDEIVENIENYQLATAQQLFDILEQREFPSELVPIWQEIKQQAVS